MKDYSASNVFLHGIYSLFEAVYIEPEIDIVTERSKKFPYKKVEIEKNANADSIYNDIGLTVKRIRTNPPSFDTIFDFCTFIKCMEKVFFYKNDIKSSICCTSRMEEKTTRKLIITLSEYITITLKLDRLNIVDECIEILVVRNYGSNLKSKIMIKNGSTSFEDTNDLMLINSLNIILENAMADYLELIAKKIYNKEILSFRLLDNMEIKKSEILESSEDNET